MNEILQGIRLIKLRAWEELFKNRIGQERDKELKLLDRDSFYGASISKYDKKKKKENHPDQIKYSLH